MSPSDADDLMFPAAARPALSVNSPLLWPQHALMKIKRRCAKCGAFLRSTNHGQLCAPCQGPPPEPPPVMTARREYEETMQEAA